ncbi:MAG: hypothetical protein AAF492_11775, partial [Verrucomicrobiota bacterium]
MTPDPKSPAPAPQPPIETGPSPFGELCYVADQEGQLAAQTFPLFSAPTGAPFPLPTFLRTKYNKPIFLQPKKAEVAFGLRPVADGGSTTYRIPSGSYTLEIQGEEPGQGVTHHLICGLEGTETISFQTGDLITFFPNKPALASSFPLFGATGPAAPVTGPLLAPNYTTSWAVITPGPRNTNHRTTYYAQPQQASLFSPGADSVPVSGPTGLHILDHFSAPAAYIGPTAGTGQAPLAFPLVPYAGLVPSASEQGVPTFTPQTLSLFEQQILNPTRREQISQYAIGPTGALSPEMALPETTGPTTTTTTPQGLLATVQDIHWRSVLLAQSGPTGAGAPPTEKLEFIELPPLLRDALQSNQLFLVATESAPLGTFANQITLEGWPFVLNVGRKPAASGFSNVLIFKFRPGTLVELLSTTAAWTHPDQFNRPDQIQPLQLWLQNYMEEARSLATEYPDFQPFVDLVNNPGWTGILALRVDINLQQFPEQLKGLLAGIDLSKFYAHHVGIEINYVHVSSGR